MIRGNELSNRELERYWDLLRPVRSDSNKQRHPFLPHNFDPLDPSLRRESLHRVLPVKWT